QLAALIDAAVFGGNGGLVNPGLQALYRFVMTFFDFSPDRFQVGLFRVRDTRKTEGSGSSGGSNYKVSSIHAREGTASAKRSLGGCLDEARCSQNAFFNRFVCRSRQKR